MNDLRREILTQVASGTLTPQEAAARLEALEAEPAPAAAPTGATAPAAPAPADVTPTAATRKVKVVSVIGSAEIIGDPTVAYAVAEGPHRVRQEGDTMTIEHAPFDQADHFTFGQSGRRVVINGMDVQRRKMTVRMNPELALIASVQAGSLRVEGVHGPIEGEVQAGSCNVSDFRSTLNMSIQAGNLSARGRLDEGTSRIRCEMGNVKITLERGSSVQLTARTTLGKVSIVGADGTAMAFGRSKQDVQDWTIGTGTANLDIECTMGSVKVAAE
jgi:hypothetical protein